MSSSSIDSLIKLAKGIMTDSKDSVKSIDSIHTKTKSIDASSATIKGDQIAKAAKVSKPAKARSVSQSPSSSFFGICNFIRSTVLSVAYPMKFVTELPSVTTHGVWYLSPEYHVFESSLIVAMALCSLHFTTQCIESSVPDGFRVPLTTSTSFDSDSEYDYGSIFNFNIDAIFNVLKYVLSFDYVLHCYYKMNDPPIGRGIWWLLQPCPVNQVFILILLFQPQLLTPQTLSYLLTLTCGAIQASLFPDYNTSRLLSKSHFWFQHLIILFVPWMWFIQYMDTMSQFLSIWIVIQVHAVCLLYQFGFLEVMAIVTGVNINYALSPPKPLKVCGTRYRVLMIGIWFTANTVCGLVAPSFVLWMLSG